MVYSNVSAYSFYEAPGSKGASRQHSLVPGVSRSFDVDYQTATFDQLLIECAKNRYKYYISCL